MAPFPDTMSFFNGIIGKWNKLNGDVVTYTSVNTSKINKLGRFMHKREITCILDRLHVY